MTAEDLRFLPALNAALNATSALLLTSGWILIRRRRVRAHVTCMVSALVLSVLFLVSYLYYHFHAGTTEFAGQGWSRPVYFTILTTHTMLAATVPFLATWTVVRAVRGRFRAHARIARITLPIWLYVAVTGVLVYLMLYQWFPSRGPF